VSASLPDEQPVRPDPPPDATPSERVSIRAHRLPIQWGVFGAVLVLVAIGIVGFLQQQNKLPSAVLTWWPLVVIVLAGFWLIRSLGQRASTRLLGSSALFGIGISLLLATAYQVSFGAIWLGLAAIAIGMGIMLRGLLWRS